MSQAVNSLCAELLKSPIISTFFIIGLLYIVYRILKPAREGMLGLSKIVIGKFLNRHEEESNINKELNDNNMHENQTICPKCGRSFKNSKWKIWAILWM